MSARAPSGLDTAGRKLWRDLTEAFSFHAGELAVLEAACRQADDIARVQAAIATDGVVVEGSKGQPRLSAAVSEVRQGRLALAKLLDQLALPAEGAEVAESPATRRARRAADVRWRRERERRGTA